MIKPAFSTVACPEWTLENVAANAARYGFEGVELRTFGEGSTQIACDPALTHDQKARGWFHAVGIEVLSLATSVSFHAPIRPPVMGRVFGDPERTVREGKRAVDLAVGLECPFVRVFGFDLPAREKRTRAVERISQRLAMVADHAQKTGVRLVLENGGGFPRAVDVIDILDAVGSPMVGACYSLAAGAAVEEDVRAAVDQLGSRLWAARIKDLDAHGKPTKLGEGRLKCREFVQALAVAGFDGPLVFEWDRLWFQDLAPADTVLPAASKLLFHWMAEFLGANATGGVQPLASGRNVERG